MTRAQRSALNELRPGMQLAFFEIIWRLFPWIQSIWVKESNGQFQLFVQTPTAPDKETSEDVVYHVREVLDESEKVLDEWFPDSKHKIEHAIQYGPSIPKNQGYRELMSDRIFKAIAKKHAPWRLEDGR